MDKNERKATKYNDISAFSGRPKECDHHLIFGNGMRELADEDGLTIPLTNAEHNMSSKGTINQIHGNPAAEKLSKMLGEAVWERNYIVDKHQLPFDDDVEDAREAFRHRYGKNFL